MSIVSRRDISPSQWDEFVERHRRGWFFHTGTWLDYCVAYHAGAADLSFAIEQDGQIVALVPLIREDATFTMGGHPGADPLYAEDQNYSVIKAYVTATVEDIGGHHAVREWKTRSVPITSKSLRLLSDAWETFVLDLSQDEALLWRNFRKSYHGLIHKAERTYTLTVTSTPEAVATAHAIHAAVAHRETRPQATWDLMGQWAQSGNLLVGLATRETEPRGMAMAIRYKDAAYYASSAQLEKNCSHALIWELAKALKRQGVAWFEIGWAERASDTPKEKNIAFFKHGFGGARHTIIPTTTTL